MSGSRTRCLRIGTVFASRAATGSWFVVAQAAAGRDIRAGPDRDERDRPTARRAVADRPAQRGISVVPLSLYVTGSATRRALWMLTGAVSLVLLMAIANIAGLSLARSAGREREIAIRSALGANQGHIVRQLLIESVTLGSRLRDCGPACGAGRHSSDPLAEARRPRSSRRGQPRSDGVWLGARACRSCQEC